MATKWKRFTRNGLTKIIAFVLAVALSGMVVWSVGMIALRLSVNDFSPDILFDKDQWIWKSMYEEHVRAGLLYDDLRSNRTEERIRAGETVTEREIVDEMYQAYLDGEAFSDVSSLDKEDRLTDKKIEKLESEIRRSVYANYGEYDENEIFAFTQWIENNRMAYPIEKGILIQQKLSDWNDRQNQLRDGQGYLYYAQSEENGFLSTNLTGSRADALRELNSCPLIYRYDTETGKFSFDYRDDIAALVEQYHETFDSSFDTYDDSYVSPYEGEYYNTSTGEIIERDSMPSDAVIAIGITSEAFDQRMNAIDTVYRETWALVIVLMACLIAVVLCCIILCAGAGRSSLDAPAKLCKLDRIWTEAQVCYVGFVLVYGAVIAVWSIKWLTSSGAGGNLALYLIPPAIGGLVAALCLPCLMSQARRVKTHTFGQGFICIRGLKWLLNQWKAGPRYVRLIVLAVAVPIVCMPYITIPFVIAALLYFGIRYVREMEKLEDGVRRIRGGETGLHIEIKQNKDLERLADDINGISDGLHNAVDSAVKSERLKSELISNVSHDLKTPLTGIVTYVDLMKQLEPDDPKMMTYLGIVDQKTKRLSTLINDLLEASKASSGAMKLELTRVDFAALLQQACGEMQEKLDMAGLELRGKTRGRTDVCADGRMLWRVLDNLLGNCVRYAAPNSRVYTDLCERNGFCVFTIKNISAVELNIPAEELMERFTRGDRARYTEGSGLGLSIAKSLTELMHGTFSLTVDGDLFKVEVAIPLWDDVWEKTRPLGPDFDPDATRRMG